LQNLADAYFSAARCILASLQFSIEVKNQDDSGFDPAWFDLDRISFVCRADFPICPVLLHCENLGSLENPPYIHLKTDLCAIKRQLDERIVQPIPAAANRLSATFYNPKSSAVMISAIFKPAVSSHEQNSDCLIVCGVRRVKQVSAAKQQKPTLLQKLLSKTDSKSIFVGMYDNVSEFKKNRIIDMHYFYA